MLVQRAYKTELDLNDRQVTACKQHAGAARWAYNWGLRVKQERYKATKKSPTAIALHRELNALKKTDVPWMYRSPSVRHKKPCGTWMRRSSSSSAAVPSRSKGRGKASSGIRNSRPRRRDWAVSGSPGGLWCRQRRSCCRGWGGCGSKSGSICRPWRADPLGDGERAGGALVCDRAGGRRAGRPREHRTGGRDRSGDQEPGHPLRWRGHPQSAPPQTPSEEAETAAAGGEPAAERRQEPQESGPKLARLHRQIKNQRRNTLHQVTTRLAKTKSVLVIEDLHVAGMLKNHHLAQAIGDVGFYEFKRQLLYKASWYGSSVILADRWEPSSKRCSGCGWIDADLTLSDRTFHCEQCGLVLDRDLNAAINLAQLAGSSSDSQNACGAASAGTRRKPRVKLAAKKQEPDTLDASA